MDAFIHSLTHSSTKTFCKFLKQQSNSDVSLRGEKKMWILIYVWDMNAERTRCVDEKNVAALFV